MQQVQVQRKLQTTRKPLQPIQANPTVIVKKTLASSSQKKEDCDRGMQTTSPNCKFLLYSITCVRFHHFTLKMVFITFIDLHTLVDTPDLQPDLKHENKQSGK